MIEKARCDVIKKQIDLGLDVITDGEIERDNYIFHCARNFKGINMDSIITKTIRDGKNMGICLLANRNAVILRYINASGLYNIYIKLCLIYRRMYD